ncbi:MAG: ATP-binding protein [Treponema sp.]|nr:ATP-binding protein [Treponema sp.]
MRVLEEKKTNCREPVAAPALCFDDRELSSYVYDQCFKDVILGSGFFCGELLEQVYSLDDFTLMIKNYMSILEKTQNKKFQEIIKTIPMSVDKFLEIFLDDLKKNYDVFRNVFVLHRDVKAALCKDKTPIDKMLDKPCVKSFCNGLNLNYLEKQLLLLAVAQKEWGWLFPDSKGDKYKSKIFSRVVKADFDTWFSLARKLNDRMLRLGLFSEAWTVREYVYAFFKDENASCSLCKIVPDEKRDIYDYHKISADNDKTLSLAISQTLEYIENQKGCWQIVSGLSDWSARNFIAWDCKLARLDLYEFSPELSYLSQEELEFYVYALSSRLRGRKAAMFISQECARKLLDCPKEGRLGVRVKTKSKGRHSATEQNGSVLRMVGCPIFVAAQGSPQDLKEGLEDLGASVLHCAEIKVPKENLREERAKEFFYERKIPEKFLQAASEKSAKLEIPPEDWEDAAEILKNATRLSPDAAMELLEENYKKRPDDDVRKNARFSFEALNTSPRIEEIVSALKNADEYQNGQYDKESGVRILCYGVSGAGKTACAEEISKMLDKPLVTARASDILGSLVGETEQNIKRVFEEAADKKAVLLIDEADSFLNERGDTLNHHNDVMTNEFLVQMERYPYIVFCNTNLPEILDSATDRRFHFKVCFKPLTKEGTEILWKKYFPDYEISGEKLNEIFRAGDITPGDFGALGQRIRFLDKEKICANYIADELKTMVAGKKDNKKSRKIGFEL